MKPPNVPTVSGFCSISDSSTPARIVRNAPDLWTISATPEPAADRSDKADLFKEVGNGSRKTITLEGTFAMPFSFTVKCVNATDCP